ncbi:helix-turn-helix domain-containing protein [Micromonospora sp. WMMD998]|uniref:helix-turn-helix domain-containing protein n=1 Tax=Micromonospora sp. WMMD998 TaxID=3016092 RepID=UPI00249C87D7|nr:helix-turn-helix domain-containing protein [Micromonospora sp. WMMD998]WFE39292.1 helix-turn-helix domain-containing protein [Micromonospora sp. WMMD998]
MDGSDLLPVGRRVAYWRGRRKLSQQMLADRLGKSKSWVDKVERGVRSLDKVSTLREIAVALRIETAVLLGRHAEPAGVAERVEGVERIRAALSTYEIALGRPVGGRPVRSVEALAGEVGHVWSTFQHARYPQVVELVPRLLADAQRTHGRAPPPPSRSERTPSGRPRPARPDGAHRPRGHHRRGMTMTVPLRPAGAAEVPVIRPT